MTNEEIIMKERVKLMKLGLIGTTGRTFEAKNENGEVVVIEEPEELHTYAVWKELGFQVQKGEKAVAKIVIWKYATKKNDDESVHVKEESSLFMKKASFFTRSQCEEIA